MSIENLKISEHKDGEVLLSDEILNGNSEKTEITKISGKATKKAIADTSNIEYVKAKDLLTMYLLGVDDKQYKSNSLTTNDIKVYVDGTEQTGVEKDLRLISQSSADGVKYALALTNITGNGELSIRIEPNTLEDAAGNKNPEKVKAVFGNDDDVNGLVNDVSDVKGDITTINTNITNLQETLKWKDLIEE